MENKLPILAEQVARYRHLTNELERLYPMKEELMTRVDVLCSESMLEQSDVERLEGRTLAALFYAIIGKREEKLDRERAEALAAAVRRDAALAELRAVEEDIARFEAEKKSLSGCEIRYKGALRDKADEVRASHGEQSERLLELEQRIAETMAGQKELSEALQAGSRAKNTADKVMRYLGSAHDLANWDTYGGGGLLSHMTKYEELDSAQIEIENLQSDLRRFDAELADVCISADIDVRIDESERFADWFFDGFFADRAVRSSIESSMTKVRTVISKIEYACGRLESRADQAAAELAKLETLREELLCRLE